MAFVSRDYQLRPVTGFAEWDACFSAVPHPHLMQAWSYGQAKGNAANWHVGRFIFEKSGTPVAICQVLEKRVAGLRAMARINRGPLFLEAQPDFQTKANVYDLLRRRWRLTSGGPLLIAPALSPSAENETLLKQAGFWRWDASPWCSALIDLGEDEATLRSRLSVKWRNQLKKSLQSGLSLHSSTAPGDVRWMLEMHALNMELKTFSGPSPELIHSLYEARPAHFTVLSAMLDGQPVAGLIIVRFGTVAEAYIGWFGSAQARKVNSGNFLYWHAFLEMKQAGCRWFDVGGYFLADGKGFGHFKQNMGGTEYRLNGEWFCC